MLLKDSKKIDIPEYYRKFQSQPSKELEYSDSAHLQNGSLTLKQNQKSAKHELIADDKIIQFCGNTFSFNMLEDWEDNTIYTITGPVTDGIQHNLIITVDKENPFETLIEYAELHIKTLESELKSCMLLKKGETKLNNGMNAYEAVFSWYPSNELRIYQHQIFVQSGKKIYKLTASFTKKTRQTLGPKIERMMLSFNPCNR